MTDSIKDKIDEFEREKDQGFMKGREWGKVIALQRTDGTYLINEDGSNLQKISNLRFGKWVDDGRSLLLADDVGLKILKLITGDETIVKHTKEVLWADHHKSISMNPTDYSIVIYDDKKKNIDIQGYLPWEISPDGKHIILEEIGCSNFIIKSLEKKKDHKIEIPFEPDNSKFRNLIGKYWANSDKIVYGEFHNNMACYYSLSQNIKKKVKFNFDEGYAISVSPDLETFILKVREKNENLLKRKQKNTKIIPSHDFKTYNWSTDGSGLLINASDFYEKNKSKTTIYIWNLKTNNKIDLIESYIKGAWQPKPK